MPHTPSTARFEKRDIRSDRGELLAIVLSGDAWPEGLTFVTDARAFVQVGLWHYPGGKRLAPHRHKEAPRTARRTQEVVYVKRGALRVRIYTETRKPVADVVLRAGDACVLLAGGHDYEILEDGTQVLEVKNGPFPGVDADKERW